MHQVRSSLRFVPYRDKRAVAADLKKIYTATDQDTAADELQRSAEKWDARYPTISRSWLEHWEQITPFLAFPPDVRRAVYTTNTIEALNRQIRKIIKTRGHFPTEDAARKLIYPRHRSRADQVATRLQLERRPRPRPPAPPTNSRRVMRPGADPELDELIADILIDAYDHDEALIGFENAFDQASCFPCPGTVIAEDIKILSVAATNGRQELIATCQRAGRRHQIALLDIDVNADQPASRLLAAYRHWTGVADPGT